MPKRWTEEEKLYLLNNWGKVNIEKLMINLDKSESSVKKQAERLGINTKKDPDKLLKVPWGIEEDKIMIEYYGVLNIEELQKLLPRRTKGSIKGRAKRLGITAECRPWTDEEKAYVKAKWGGGAN